MDVGARNRLLECSVCHSLYHQECHTPVVTALEADDVWICQSCKDERRPAEKSPSPPVAVQQPLAALTKQQVMSSSKVSSSHDGHRSSSSSSSSSSSNGKSSSGSSKSSGKCCFSIAYSTKDCVLLQLLKRLRLQVNRSRLPANRLHRILT